MDMVTRLSRKVVVVMVFRNDWAAEGRQTELKGAKSGGFCFYSTYYHPDG